MVEQIDKENHTMIYDYFDFKGDIVKRKTLKGNLSLKSKEILEAKLNKQDISITQNFFYDMVFEGMTRYQDLHNADGFETQLLSLNGSKKIMSKKLLKK